MNNTHSKLPKRMIFLLIAQPVIIATVFFYCFNVFIAEMQFGIFFPKLCILISKLKKKIICKMSYIAVTNRIRNYVFCHKGFPLSRTMTYPGNPKLFPLVTITKCISIKMSEWNIASVMLFHSSKAIKLSSMKHSVTLHGYRFSIIA